MSETTLRVAGMTCTNCEVAIERALQAMPGIARVTADHRRGLVKIEHEPGLDGSTVHRIVEEEGYQVDGEAPEKAGVARENRAGDYLSIAAIFAILAGAYFALRSFDLIPKSVGVSDAMNLGLVFVIGLVASVSSCMAVTGGLLVALATKYNEASSARPGWQRLKPLIYFNVGRVLSYTLAGGAVGALGSILSLSARANGILTLIASATMIALGLSMLKLLPSFGGIGAGLGKRFGHAVHSLSARDAKGGALLLGAATFLLPCGFTQALQLYVLAKGSFATGALTMLAFALGTLPALLSLSAISSFAQGGFQRHFLKVAGAAVVLMGFLNIQYGLVLTGSESVVASATTQQAASVQGTTTRIENGKQIAVMRVIDLTYEPSQFIIKQGVPVEWRIDASEAASCGRVLIAPSLGIRTILSDRSTTILAFTPTAPGEYAFNCGMGMMTPGSKFIVLPQE